PVRDDGAVGRGAGGVLALAPAEPGTGAGTRRTTTDREPAGSATHGRWAGRPQQRSFFAVRPQVGAAAVAVGHPPQGEGQTPFIPSHAPRCCRAGAGRSRGTGRSRDRPVAAWEEQRPPAPGGRGPPATGPRRA